MPTPDMQDQTLWGPINNKRKKPELDKIAQALGIYNSKDRKDFLLKKLKDHLNKHPELAKEKRFQGLFVYRKDKEAESGAPKSSIDKEAEDELEASTTTKQATGALKTLVDQDIVRDPPAHTAHLNGHFTRSSAPSKAAAEASWKDEESSPEALSTVPLKSRTPITSDSELTEPESMTRNADDLQVEDAASKSSGDGGAAFPETPKKTQAQAHNGAPRGRGGQGLNPDIVVAFQHDSGPVDEVHVPGAGQFVHQVRDQQGNEHTTVCLSELLPLTFEYASTPMKNHGGCLSRPGTIGDSHVDIGSVAAFACKERVKYLESEKANNYELEPAPDDGNTLVCCLFVRGESTPEVQLFERSTLATPVPVAPGPGTTTVEPGPLSNINLKGAQPGPEVQAGKSVDDPFIVWLREKLDGPKREWKKGLLVADVLPCVKALHNALERLGDWGWEKSQGGYQVPEGRQFHDGGAGTYTGRSFKKDDVLKALRLESTTANSNDKLFVPAIMHKIPQLQEWFDHPDGPQAATFEHMGVKDFMEWRDNELEPAKAHKGKEKAKKHKYAVSESDEGHSKKAKKKAKCVSSDSEDLD